MTRTLMLCLTAGALALAPLARAAEPPLRPPWVAPARALEDQAEDAVDALSAHPVDAVWIRHVMAAMATRAEVLRAAAAVNTAASERSAPALERIREAASLAAAGRYEAAALAADEATALLQPLEGMSTPQEADVARLDYLARAVVILSRPPASPGTPELEVRMEEIRTVWARLRPWYAARRGAAALVASTDTCVGRIRAGAPADERIAAASRLGDLVDELETYLPRRA